MAFDGLRLMTIKYKVKIKTHTSKCEVRISCSYLCVRTLNLTLQCNAAQYDCPVYLLQIITICLYSESYDLDWNTPTHTHTTIRDNVYDIIVIMLKKRRRLESLVNRQSEYVFIFYPNRVFNGKIRTNVPLWGMKFDGPSDGWVIVFERPPSDSKPNLFSPF